MLETPEIVETKSQVTAVIGLVVPRSEIQEVMGPGIRELLKTVAEQGVAIVGPWFTRHLRMPSEVFDFEISIPVASKVREQGRVRAGELPGVRALHAAYEGPYQGLGGAWGELKSWAEREGIATAGWLWEVYTVGPETGLPEEKYRTDLFLPLKP
jgi:effector-binding domain-containing protein